MIQHTISIHALLAESDYDTSSLMQCQVRFLSTLSLRRATSSIDDLEPSTTHFYPRSPCGERRYLGAWKSCNVCHFYPRSPCGERRLFRRSWSLFPYFYPRSPCGERRAPPYNLMIQHAISIHALLAESDHIRSTSGGHPGISIHALLAESDAGQSGG